jgi:quercetin dioxygenase-like cupin family protein
MMESRAVLILAFVLGLVLLISHGELSPVSAREQQLQGASIGSAADKDGGSSVEAHISSIPPPKRSEPSSKPAASFVFACDPSSQGVSQYEGGTVAYCVQKDLQVATTDSALIEIKAGAARAPHWHDTWEQQIVISGKAKTFLIDEKGQVHEEVLAQGMVAVLPAGMTHWTETIGDQSSVLLLSFPSGFKTFELDDSLIQVGRNDESCASGGGACSAKPKSLILMVKDGLL